jgi:sortase (surface protein transpeptidase)
MDNGRVAGLKKLIRATARRRLALVVVLLVVGGGMIALILHHHGEPSRVASPAGPAVITGENTTTSSAPAVGDSAPGKQYAPMRIEIPAIAASAPVDPLGLNADGTLQVPTDYARAGWYTGRPPPGAIGPAIIVAHVDSKSGPAVFARLRELKPGDQVTVTRADRSDVVFVIDRLESAPKNAFPTGEVYDPTPGATLRLITCTGSFDHSTGHYLDNEIAFAHYQSVTPPPAGA